MKKIGNYLIKLLGAFFTLAFALYLYGFVVLMKKIIKEEKINDKEFAEYSLIIVMNMLFICVTLKFILYPV